MSEFYNMTEEKEFFVQLTSSSGVLVALTNAGRVFAFNPSFLPPAWREIKIPFEGNYEKNIVAVH